MKRDINPRETLAWIVLACAAFLFTITVAFAQEKSEARKGSATIRIIKKEDGKTTKIDTTISSNDEAAIDKIFKDLGMERGMNFNFSFPEHPGDGDHLATRHHEMSKKEREELKEEMEHLNEEMKGLDKQMKDIHIEIHSDGDTEDGKSDEHSFNFEMPGMPDIEDFDFSDDHCKEKIRHHTFLFHDADSLTDDDHIIIMGDEDEQAPVFEKEVTGKNGEKVFVYKRIRPGNEKQSEQPAEKEDQSQVKLFPNPNNGKFSLSFHSDTKDDLSIRVFDSRGKQVFSEKLKDFSGDYSNQLDLSGKAKGNYILSILLGEKTITEKFVIE